MIVSNCSHRSGRNDSSLEAAGDVGPSPTVRAWVAFFEELGDWLIDARRRWREGDPPTPAGVRRLALGWAPLVVAATVLLRHLLGA